MSTNKTTHYQLNQWEAEDKVLRSEFNEDNQKIDAALAGLVSQLVGKADKTELAALPRILIGSYTGTGTTTKTHYSLGARPKVVLLATNNNFNDNTHHVFFVATEIMTFDYSSNGYFGVYYDELVTFDDDGFFIDHSLSAEYLGYNRAGYEQVYWAVC